LYFADTAGLPGPHHGLLRGAYQAYLTAREEYDRDESAPPPATDPHDTSRTTAHL
jgi:hypothetical protein